MNGEAKFKIGDLICCKTNMYWFKAIVLNRSQDFELYKLYVIKDSQIKGTYITDYSFGINEKAEILK